MEQEILQKLKEQDEKINLILESVEKTRRYFMWTLIITIVLFVLPLIGLVFIIPALISTYTSTLGLP